MHDDKKENKKPRHKIELVKASAPTVPEAEGKTHS